MLCVCFCPSVCLCLCVCERVRALAQEKNQQKSACCATLIAATGGLTNFQLVGSLLCFPPKQTKEVKNKAVLALLCT